MFLTVIEPEAPGTGPHRKAAIKVLTYGNGASRTGPTLAPFVDLHPHSAPNDRVVERDLTSFFQAGDLIEVGRSPKRGKVTYKNSRMPIDSGRQGTVRDPLAVGPPSKHGCTHEVES